MTACSYITQTDFMENRVTKLRFLQKASCTASVNSAVTSHVQLLEIALKEAAMIACKLKQGERDVVCDTPHTFKDPSALMTFNRAPHGMHWSHLCYGW